MRITNKIISNNSVTNINNNKIYEDRLNTQLSTGSKINRPSDDPVIAIRALRLRTNLNEVSQYYSKNIPDAESWLDVTESAVDTTIYVRGYITIRDTETGNIETVYSSITGASYSSLVGNE